MTRPAVSNRIQASFETGKEKVPEFCRPSDALSISFFSLRVFFFFQLWEMSKISGGPPGTGPITKCLFKALLFCPT
jgi:hypothetical protein